MKTLKKKNRIITTPTNCNRIFENANTALHSGNYEEALHLFNMFLLFEPFHHTALLRKGQCFLYMEQFDAAYAIFEMVLGEDEENALGFYCLAEFYKLRCDLDTARQLVGHALLLDEDNASYNQLAAEISYFQESYDEAFTFINKAIVLNPFREELYYWRALLFVHFEKYNIAENDLNRALSINPNYAEALRLRARTLMLNNETERALADIREAQKLEGSPVKVTRLAA
jgi:tetratricopeptide (TPR) repeat protein